MDVYGVESTKNRGGFPVDMNSLAVVMVATKKTYGRDAAMEELGEEAAALGTVRGPGRFPPMR